VTSVSSSKGASAILCKPAPNPKMGLVRKKDTEPERQLRRRLWAEGIHYRLHVRTLPGTPDIVIPSSRLIVFVNGCFWHRHAGCARATAPKANAEFWRTKFDLSCERDMENCRRLRSDGWLVMVIWECEIKRDAAAAAERVVHLHGTVLHGFARPRRRVTSGCRPWRLHFSK
jgi:DNA mismatch endonuclease, patch repair protein